MEGANITIAVAFAAGFLSFLSPCVLPLVPGYVSLISGVSIEGLKSGSASRSSAFRSVIVNSLAFNAGLSVIFLTLGAAAGWLGGAITSNPWIRIIGGLVIIAFGFQLIGLLKIGTLYKDTRFFSHEKPRGVAGSMLLGMAFAAGWTPCIGPILGGIIGLAATSGGWRSGLLLSAFYSAGLAMPFLLTGLGINKFLGFYAKFRKHLHKVEVASGVMLILIGFLVATGYTSLLARYGASLPNLESVLNYHPAAQVSKTDSGAPGVYPPAPEIELKSLAGEKVRLSDLRGRVVLLNFWATWCGPCRAEIPELSAMQRDLESKGLSIVGVSWNDSLSDINEFQKSVKQEYTILLNGEDVGSKFGGVASFPTTYIIDRNGRIRNTLIGQKDRAGFEAVVKPLLDEAPVTARNN